MLAKTPITEQYLSAAELGITEQEREALLWVREELASGRIEHSRPSNGNIFEVEVPLSFNMVDVRCGSVACIKGWAEHYLQNDLAFEGASEKPTGCLFFPSVGDYPNLTPAQAVRAIDYWATGHRENCWALALADEPA